jgi:GNAT superfamily N-acetyltransferase
MIDGVAVGIAVLKAKCITTHSHLTPWIGGGMVLPQYRRSGIGARLATELENIARRLGHKTIFSGTSTANSLLERSGWSYIETIHYGGENVSIYEKAL